MPAASASIPSIRLTRFASSGDPQHRQRIRDPAEVEVADERQRQVGRTSRRSRRPGSARSRSRRASFVLRLTPADVVDEPERGDAAACRSGCRGRGRRGRRRSPPGSGSRPRSRGRRCAGSGRVCTRGRSAGSSSAPMRGASRTTSGVRTSTIADGEGSPRPTVPSRIRALERLREGHAPIIAKVAEPSYSAVRQSGLDGLPAC